MLIKKLYEDAILPTRGSEYAAGFDLYAHHADNMKENYIFIHPHKTVPIRTGIACQIPENCFGGIFARSGLATKKGLRPANCTGVIDEDYTGEVIVALHNDTDETVSVLTGERIAQLVIIPYRTDTLELVDDLPETKRGSRGFGSTGEK